MWFIHQYTENWMRCAGVLAIIKKLYFELANRKEGNYYTCNVATVQRRIYEWYLEGNDFADLFSVMVGKPNVCMNQHMNSPIHSF